MKSAVLLRLILSAIIAFVSYAAWAYYANSLVTNNVDILLKAALVQGTYSGGITLLFTILLEASYQRLGAKSYCLPFIIPRLNKQPSRQDPCSTLETFSASLELSKKKCGGTCLPGVIISPLPALVIQSLLVVSVNVIFETPNLWLTVAPSIFFSAVYGYAYSIVLARKKPPN